MHKQTSHSAECRIRVLLTMLLFSGFLAGLLPAAGAQRLVVELIPPSTNWWYGNAVQPSDGNSLLLTERAPEVTLAGTAVNPKNMAAFTATLRWKFGASKQAQLWVGWGKAFDWGAFETSAERLLVRPDGQVSVFAGNREIGSAQIAVSDQGECALTFSQETGAISLGSGGEKTVLPVPPDARGAAGYLTLRASGLERGVRPLRIEHLELQYEGELPPLTEAQRTAEIYQWEQRQLHGNWSTLTNFENYFKSKEAGR